MGRSRKHIDDPAPARAATRFISDMASALASSLDRGSIIEHFVSLAVEQLSDSCAVHLVGPDGRLILAGLAEHTPSSRSGVDTRAVLQRDLDGPVGALREALARGEPLLISRTDEPLSLARAALLQIARSSVIVVPLILVDVPLGVVSFFGGTADYANEAELTAAAVAGARLLIPVLENIALFEREQQISERYRFLARMTDELFASLDPTTTLRRLIDSMIGDFADAAAAALLEGDGLRFAAVAGKGLMPAVQADLRHARPYTPEAERALVAVLRAGRTRVRTGSEASRLRGTIRPYLQAAFAQLVGASEVVVPLFVGDKTYGAILCFAEDRDFSREDVELLSEIGRRASLALEHADSFARERRLAQTLQEATLPAQLPTVPGAILTSVYSAAAAEVQVGGDWYDAFELDNGRILLTIGDVTGHGLQAAVIMGKLRHTLNVVAKYESDLTRVLDAAEDVVLRRYPDAIATAFVAIYDTRHRTLTYANAGHPCPLLRLFDGSIVELAAEGLPIGLRSYAESGPAMTRPLDGGSLLVLYTDGLTEVTRDPLEGQRCLYEALVGDTVLYVQSPASFIERRCLPGAANDDVAMLVLNFARAEQWSFDAENAIAAQDARGDFVSYLRARVERGSDLASSELIFGELVGNVVRHAPGPIDIALAWEGRRAILHVIDRGPGFGDGARPPADLLNEGGRGLWFVQRLGCGFSVETIRGFGAHARAVLPVTLRTEAPRVPTVRGEAQDRNVLSSRSSCLSIADHSISPKVRRTPGV